MDGRKRPVRGLWQRNARYYARLAVTDRETGHTQVRRVPLNGVTTAAQAQAELRRLQTQREAGELPVLRQAPKFRDYVAGYRAHYEAVRDAKRPGTLATERVHLRAWQEHLSDTRLTEITPAMINAYIARRQAGGWIGRTVNLSVTILRNVLLSREQAEGSPLTQAEVMEIRDSCPSVAVPIDVVAKIDAERGYKDIDPEQCWEQWQESRKSLI